jgi:hypothetical protein
MIARPLVALCLLAALALALPAAAQHHPASHPPLTADGPFPRCTPVQLARAGFPDHMHAWTWSTWQTPRDAAGREYGPGTFCANRQLRAESFPGLTMEPSRKILGRVVLQHNPGYGPCDMLPFLSLVDLARRHVGEQLGLDAPDTLRLFNPDNNDHYRQLTGQGTWRFYRWRDGVAVLQPVPTLQARGLDGHAAHQLVAEWLLTGAVGAPLPLWLTHGLAEYLAEDGVHLVNYMVEFRDAGPVLLAPGITEHVLGAGVDADPSRDREMYRRASYSAFLMAWELVENQGGLEALREFLHAVRDGADPDAAAAFTWGMDLAELAQFLDPLQLGEPIGTAVETRRPQVEP